MKEVINLNNFEYIASSVYRNKLGNEVLISSGLDNILLKSDCHISIVINPFIIATNDTTGDTNEI